MDCWVSFVEFSSASAGSSASSSSSVDRGGGSGLSSADSQIVFHHESPLVFILFLGLPRTLLQ